MWNATATGSRQIIRLLILWGTRNEETCTVMREWRNEDVLTIPGAYTKNGRDHGIPLLPLAVGILNARPIVGSFYFPGRHSSDVAISAGSLNRIKHEVQGETGTGDWTLRDIRRTLRSNMARLGVPREVCEVLINHAPPVLDEIYDRYDRYDRLSEKRQALAKYEDFLIQLVRSFARAPPEPSRRLPLGRRAMKLLSKRQVREKVLYSFAHVARLEAAGLFPSRVPLGPGRVGYVEEEVDDWIMARMAARKAHTGS